VAESSGEEAARAGSAALGKSSDTVSKHVRYDWSIGPVGNWVTLHFTVVTALVCRITASRRVSEEVVHDGMNIALCVFSTNRSLLDNYNATVYLYVYKASKHVTRQLSITHDQASTQIRLADSLPLDTTSTDAVGGGPDCACSHVNLTAALKLPWIRWVSSSVNRRRRGQTSGRNTPRWSRKCG
jgi:hypothetical protein